MQLFSYHVEANFVRNGHKGITQKDASLVNIKYPIKKHVGKDVLMQTFSDGIL